MEYLKQEQLFDRGIIVLNNDINTVPRSRYLGEPNDGATVVNATGHQLTYDYQLNDDWSLTAGYNYRDSSLKGFSSDAELAKGDNRYLMMVARSPDSTDTEIMPPRIIHCV